MNIDMHLSGSVEDPCCMCGDPECRVCLEHGYEPPHLSDCAVYNEPATPNGPCNCRHRLATAPVPATAEIFESILKWARDRNLIEGSSAQAQTVKLLEEAGELAGGVARHKPDIVRDSIGDCAVVLIILAAQYGFDFGDCVRDAYLEIKDRKGRMVDGFFVKEE